MVFDWIRGTQTIRERVDLEAGGIRYTLVQRKSLQEFAEGKLEKIATDQDLKFTALKNLEADGLLVDGLLPFQELSTLDSVYRRVLGISEAKGWKLKVAVGSTIGKGDPSIKLHWRDAQGGPLDPERFLALPCGFFDKALAKLYVLPQPILAMRELARAPRFENRLDEYRFISRLQEEIRALDGETHLDVELEVDNQLVGEDYIVPEVVDVAVEQTESGDLRLRPIIEGVADFEDAAFLEEADRPLVDRRLGLWGRQRFALSEDVRRDVQKIRAHATVPRQQVKAFLEDPAGYLGAETGDRFEFQRLDDDLSKIDLSLYSGRVEGVEEYVRSEPVWTGESVLGGGWFREKGEEIGVVELPEREPDHVPASSREVLATADNEDELEYATESKLEEFQKFGPPRRLAAEKLYDHQKVGYVWLRNLWEVAKDHDDGQGGLLADDMGLGKTLQVIALMAHLFEENNVGPVLIVAPKTVIPNWEREVQRFVHKCPRIYRHEGPDRLRRKEDIERNAVILTTFSTLRNDQLVLGKVPFGLLVLDEAQNIKNYGTQQARAARAMQAQLRLALTATPVENSLEDLWAIMDFAQPSLLSSKADFKARYEEPIERRGPEGAQATRGLLAALGNHYLRRTKEEELADQLPNKTHQVFEAPMSPQQLEIYDAVRRWYVATRQGPLPAISGLIMACAHPLAVNPDVLEAVGYSKSFTQETKGVELMEMSAKFAYLREALEHVASAGEKAILFTRFKDLQLLLQRFLSGQFKIHPRIVNGEVAGNSRQSLIDRFNEGKGFDCIIMSTDAAGVGVNVTGANHVFHVTRPWNPAKEMQATDRAYRIGQTRDVTVHLPVITHPTMNSLDKLLHNLLESKRELATQVIRPSGSLDITWEDLEEGLGRAESSDEMESVLPTNLPSYEVPELVLRLLESSLLQERLVRYALKVDDLKAVISFTLGRDGRTSVNHLARCMNRDAARIAWMVSPMMNVLNVDGYEVLRREEGFLHLNEALLRQQFKLG